MNTQLVPQYYEMSFQGHHIVVFYTESIQNKPYKSISGYHPNIQNYNLNSL